LEQVASYHRDMNPATASTKPGTCPASAGSLAVNLIIQDISISLTCPQAVFDCASGVPPY
jgi:hypothetical protein